MRMVEVWQSEECLCHHPTHGVSNESHRRWLCSGVEREDVIDASCYKHCLSLKDPSKQPGEFLIQVDCEEVKVVKFRKLCWRHFQCNRSRRTDLPVAASIAGDEEHWYTSQHRGS